MDEDKKKTIMIVIIIACLAVAGFIFIKSITGGDKGLNAIPADAMTLVMCRNPKCKAVYEMSTREYTAQMQEAMSKMMMLMETPGLACKECGEESIYKAIKCPECELVFEENSVSGDIFDRCPKCKYSEFEAGREERKKSSD
ncbi:MAG: hypothetical protein ISS77_06080 [Phycisphaerae bacterium]|nr:hypothetical protein [Phycisphaerae bacterium]